MSKEDAPNFRVLTACDNCKYSIVNEWHGLYCQKYLFQSVLALTRERQHILDLVEVKEKHVLWLNIYCQHKDDTWISKEEADKYSADERFARIKVTYEEGQFDE